MKKFITIVFTLLSIYTFNSIAEPNCPAGQFACEMCCDKATSKCAFDNTVNQKQSTCMKCSTGEEGCNNKCCGVNQYCKDWSKKTCATKPSSGSTRYNPLKEGCINNKIVPLCSSSKVPMCGNECCATNECCNADNKCQTISTGQKSANGICQCLEGAQTCGNMCCGTQQVCENKVCKSCESGETPCATTCCASGEICKSNKCQACKSGETACGDVCCPEGHICKDGQCQQCPSGQFSCVEKCCDIKTQICTAGGDSKGQCGTCGLGSTHSSSCNTVCCGKNQICSVFTTSTCKSCFLTCGSECCHSGDHCCGGNTCCPSDKACINGKCTACTSSGSACIDKCCAEGFLCGTGNTCECPTTSTKCGENCCSPMQFCNQETSKCEASGSGAVSCGKSCCPKTGYICTGNICKTCPSGTTLPCDGYCCPEGFLCGQGVEACQCPSTAKNCGDTSCKPGQYWVNGKCQDTP